MTKDRTEELRAESANAKAKPKYTIAGPWRRTSSMMEDAVALTTNYKKPSTTKSAKKEQESLDGIFKQVTMITKWIESIRNDTMLLKQCHMILQQSTRPETSTKDKIQCLMGNIRSLSSRTRGSLEELKRIRITQSDSGVRRIIESQCLILTKNFSDAVQDYQSALEYYRKRNEDILKKQLLITDKEVTSEELSNLLDNEDTAVFADDFLKDTSIARQQLQEARNRHAELIAIEKEIADVRDIFLDIAMHVNIQGEMIDSIEYHITKGVDRTVGGTDLLSKAVVKRKKARKKKVMLTVCLIIVLTVLILVILIQFG